MLSVSSYLSPYLKPTSRERRFANLSTSAIVSGSGLKGAVSRISKDQLDDHYVSASKLGVLRTAKLLLSNLESEMHDLAVCKSVGSAGYAHRVARAGRNARDAFWKTENSDEDWRGTGHDNILAWLSDLIDTWQPTEDAPTVPEEMLEIYQNMHQLDHIRRMFDRIAMMDARSNVMVFDSSVGSYYQLSSSVCSSIADALKLLQEIWTRVAEQTFSKEKLQELEEIPIDGASDDTELEPSTGYNNNSRKRLLSEIDKVHQRLELRKRVHQMLLSALHIIAKWNCFEHNGASEPSELLPLYHAKRIWKFLHWMKNVVLTNGVPWNDIVHSKSSSSMETQEMDEEDLLTEELSLSAVEPNAATNESSEKENEMSKLIKEVEKFCDDRAAEIRYYNALCQDILPKAIHQANRWCVGGCEPVHCTPCNANSGQAKEILQIAWSGGSLKSLVHVLSASTYHTPDSSKARWGVSSLNSWKVQRNSVTLVGGLSEWQLQWQALAETYENTLREWINAMTDARYQTNFASFFTEKEARGEEDEDFEDTNDFSQELMRQQGGAEPEDSVASTAKENDMIAKGEVFPRYLIDDNPNLLADIPDGQQQTEFENITGVWRTKGYDKYVWTRPITPEEKEEWDAKIASDPNTYKNYMIYQDKRSKETVLDESNMKFPLYLVTKDGKPDGLRMRLWNPEFDIQQQFVNVEGMPDVTVNDSRPTLSIDAVTGIITNYPMERLVETGNQLRVVFATFGQERIGNFTTTTSVLPTLASQETQSEEGESFVSQQSNEPSSAPTEQKKVPYLYLADPMNEHATELYEQLLTLEVFLCAALAQSGLFDPTTLHNTWITPTASSTPLQVPMKMYNGHQMAQWGPLLKPSDEAIERVARAMTIASNPALVENNIRELKSLVHQANVRLQTYAQTIGMEACVSWRQEQNDLRQWTIVPKLKRHAPTFTNRSAVPASKQPCLSREKDRCGYHIARTMAESDVNRGTLVPVCLTYFQALRRAIHRAVQTTLVKNSQVRKLEFDGIVDPYIEISRTQAPSCGSLPRKRFVNGSNKPCTEMSLQAGLLFGCSDSVFDRSSVHAYASWVTQQKLKKAQTDLCALLEQAARSCLERP
jgi:hypothetical protein